MTILFRQGFGFNTNVYDTNILNLTVVLIVVVKVVGDSLRTVLDERRQTILSTLQEADQKAREAKRRLEKAQRDLEEARIRAQNIRIQTVQTVENENETLKSQLSRDLSRLKERSRQAIELERQRVSQSISCKISDIALISAENVLLNIFKSENISGSKQKELNEKYIREIFCNLK
jgi:F-type H+-transporting ATPase subunit b